MCSQLFQPKKMHTFLVKEWVGEPKETDEMLPKWFPIRELPIEMWPADKYLFPYMLSNKFVEAKVYFLGKGDGIKRIELLRPKKKTIEP